MLRDAKRQETRDRADIPKQEQGQRRACSHWTVLQTPWLFGGDPVQWRPVWCGRVGWLGIGTRTAMLGSRNWPLWQNNQENSYSKRHVAKARATGGIAQNLCQQKGLARSIGLKLVHRMIFSRLWLIKQSLLFTCQLHSSLCFIYSSFYTANTRAACVCRDCQPVLINPEMLQVFSDFADTHTRPLHLQNNSPLLIYLSPDFITAIFSHPAWAGLALWKQARAISFLWTYGLHRHQQLALLHTVRRIHLRMWPPIGTDVRVILNSITSVNDLCAICPFSIAACSPGHRLQTGKASASSPSWGPLMLQGWSADCLFSLLFNSTDYMSSLLPRFKLSLCTKQH